MGKLYYYIPRATVTGQTWPGTAKAVGLEHVGGCHIAARELAHGPDGGRGTLVVCREPGAACDERIRYDAKVQTWTACNGGAFWSGFEADARPGPGDLARAEPVGGYLVRLADGQEWTVPLCRCFPHGTRLPETLHLSPDGALETRLKPAYVALSERCEGLASRWMAAMEADRWGLNLEVREVFDLASELLGVNYRVSAWEVGALGLLDRSAADLTVFYAVDGPAMARAVQEKNSEASPVPSSAGSEG